MGAFSLICPFTENVHSDSVWGGRKLDRFRDEVVDEAVGADKLSLPAGVQSNVTVSILPPTPAAVSRRRAGPAGGRGAKRCHHGRGSECIRAIQRGFFRGGDMSTPPPVSIGGNASGGIASTDGTDDIIVGGRHGR